LAFFFPWQSGGAGVLFTQVQLNDSFGIGANQSYLLNDSGDILIHADFELVRGGVNVADRNYTRFLRDNTTRNSQTLFTDEDGLRYFRAFTKLNIGGCTVITSIEYDKVFEGIEATTRRNIYLTAAVLLISIMLIWFFAKSISIPLKALAKAAQVIEGGAFEVDLQPKGHDEVGVLTASFQRMCSALGIFGRFTNRDIAVRAMRGEIRPGGLPKHATIFFSDIRGFTEKSENFTKTFGDEASDRIVHWLNEYLTRMVECVEKTNGAVDKFIGDAVMAHWGTAYTSGSPKKDACNCVAAALMMRKAVYTMNKERKQNDPGNPPINIGCGINTGIVTAGQIGSDLRMEYTVIGDPVNLASRIESLNKPLGTDILISEDTWNLVRGQFLTEEMPSVTVKGKKKPLRIFAVVNFAGIKKGPQTLADLRRGLGIKAPDISKVDVNAHEEKYAIGGTE
jgi:adenylate cyclase